MYRDGIVSICTEVLLSVCTEMVLSVYVLRYYCQYVSTYRDGIVSICTEVLLSVCSEMVLSVYVPRYYCQYVSMYRDGIVSICTEVLLSVYVPRCYCQYVPTSGAYCFIVVNFFSNHSDLKKSVKANTVLHEVYIVHTHVFKAYTSPCIIEFLLTTPRSVLSCFVIY